MVGILHKMRTFGLDDLVTHEDWSTKKKKNLAKIVAGDRELVKKHKCWHRALDHGTIMGSLKC